jgi:DNA-binding NtrC family response regulator
MDWTDQHAASPPTVLVADPDAATRAWVRSVLQEIGLGVSEARGATELWNCMRREKVALVLVEARLPQTRTDTLVAELNRRDLTVVLMSGHPQGLKKAQLPRDVVLLHKPLQLRDVLRVAIVSLPTWSRPGGEGRGVRGAGCRA